RPHPHGRGLVDKSQKCPFIVHSTPLLSGLDCVKIDISYEKVPEFKAEIGGAANPLSLASAGRAGVEEGSGQRRSCRAPVYLFQEGSARGWKSGAAACTRRSGYSAPTIQRAGAPKAPITGCTPSSTGGRRPAASRPSTAGSSPFTRTWVW